MKKLLTLSLLFSIAGLQAVHQETIVGSIDFSKSSKIEPGSPFSAKGKGWKATGLEDNFAQVVFDKKRSNIPVVIANALDGSNVEISFKSDSGFSLRPTKKGVVVDWIAIIETE